jgi:hypothetical protein
LFFTSEKTENNKVPVPQSKTKRGRGRPTKRTPQLEKALMTAIGTGAPYRIACMACGISEDVFANWRRADLVFAEQVERVAGQTALRLLQKIEAQGKENFSACAWLLERRFPESFSRPEVQLNLIQQNNVTQNYLSISITAGEYAGIEAVADPVRQSVASMFSQYKPGLIGNGEGADVKEAVASSVQQPAKPPVITHQSGDEKRASFWRTLVSSDPEKTLVARETATFVCRTILAEVLGYRASGAKIEFKDDPLRLCDVLGAIDKLCEGPGGWQVMQKKAGF